MIGGSTTSLLSILNELDYTRYSVSLLLLERGNDELYKEIPKAVRILPFAYNKKLPLKLRKRLSLKCWKAHIFRYAPRKREQLISQAMANFSRKLDERYDIAVGFLECWPLYYVATNVQALRKVNWIHVNYSSAGFDASLDKKYIDQFNGFALVSQSCCDDFIRQFNTQDKAFVIPNILSAKVIRKKAKTGLPDFSFEKNGIKFVSVCRLDCKHKGLDRAIKAFAEIKRKHGDQINYIWIIIGDGDDRNLLNDMIQKNNLQSHIILLGQKINPHPYVKECDVFLLPSHYEGKPMAVTEAQMLGVVPCITNYSSASEQVENMIDGIIMDNTDSAIEETLYKILTNQFDIEAMHQRILHTEYSNLSDMKKVMRLLEE